MDDLFEILEKIQYAKNDVTLEYVFVNVAQDAQYSNDADVYLMILMKYKDYMSFTIRDLKLKFMMKDSSF